MDRKKKQIEHLGRIGPEVVCRDTGWVKVANVFPSMG